MIFTIFLIFFHLDGACPRPRVSPEVEVGHRFPSVEGRHHLAVPAELDRGRAPRQPPGGLADHL